LEIEKAVENLRANRSLRWSELRFDVAAVALADFVLAG
jgi:hypothetical protein